MLNRTQLRQIAMDALRGLAQIETDLDLREHCRMSADDLFYFVERSKVIASSQADTLEKVA